MATTSTAAPKKSDRHRHDLKRHQHHRRGEDQAWQITSAHAAHPHIALHQRKNAQGRQGGRQRLLAGLQNQNIAGAEADIAQLFGNTRALPPDGEQIDPVLLLKAKALGRLANKDRVLLDHCLDRADFLARFFFRHCLVGAGGDQRQAVEQSLEVFLRAFESQRVAGGQCRIGQRGLDPLAPLAMGGQDDAVVAELEIGDRLQGVRQNLRHGCLGRIGGRDRRAAEVARALPLTRKHTPSEADEHQP